MISLHYVLIFSLFYISCKRTVQSQKLTTLFKEGNCECEKNYKISTRIIGGKPIQPHEFPWMAAVFSKGTLFCGGSLINDRYILTAGHCLHWISKESISVALGLHDRTLFETQRRGGEEVEVEDIKVHENFSSKYLHDVEDIGLIKLKNPVTFTQKIKPVCLPDNADEDFSNKTAIIIGWGKISFYGRRAELLKQASVTIISNKDCSKIPKIGSHILDSMLCAYAYKVDACQGDSGGPLFYKTKTGRTEQVGIVSWGIGCAKPGSPGVYTRITSHTWIGLLLILETQFIARRLPKLLNILLRNLLLIYNQVLSVL